MIKFPVVPFWFEVEYDGRSFYTCFDFRDALQTVEVLIHDESFIHLFSVYEFAVICYFNKSPLFSFVWSVSDFKDKEIDFDSAKVFKFFDLEESYDGGSEKS